MESLQNKTVSGVIWRLSQTFFSSGLSFLFALFLTRMLSPSDYGLIGMLMVFITLSQAFIDCGFGQALIRKENRTTVDESTVFYFNLGASLICYGILFVIAPWVADFYNMPILCQLLRVLGLNVILGALSAIQGLLYTIKLDFRTPMLVAFVSNMIAGSIALFMAYQGYGVWSLVAQQLLRTLSITLIYYAISSWRPILAFSRDTFHEMFSFGVNILGSSILNTMYNQINKMVIGKFYSAADLGMYAKSEELLAFPCNTIYSTLSSVSYPVLCRMQSDKERLTSVYQRFVGVISFFVTPIMALMGVFSRDLFRVLFGEQWTDASIFMSIVCIPWLVVPVQCLNLNLLQVMGRTDLLLRAHIITKIVCLTILVIVIPWGVLAICWGGTVGAYLVLYVNLHYTSKFINYSFLAQIKDIMRPVPVALLAALGIYTVAMAIENPMIRFIVELSAGGGLYLLLAYLFRMHELRDVISVVKNYIKR